MCRVFVGADPQLYRTQGRSLRLHGVATSIRLERIFWQILEEIGDRDRLTVNQLIEKLYDELAETGVDLTNFTSFLRVSCVRYLALQLDGAIPSETSISISDLDASAVLSCDRWSTQ